MLDASTPATSTTANVGGVPPHVFARGMAALRMYVGLVFFANGLAKLFEFNTFHITRFWYANLIDRADSRRILANLSRSQSDPKYHYPGDQIPLIPWIANHLLLPHWNIFQWVTTATELGIGALLIIGLASRLAAVSGVGFHLFLASLYLKTGVWLFEQPHEYVPLIILALVPAGVAWGVDGQLRNRRPAWRRWPF